MRLGEGELIDHKWEAERLLAGFNPLISPPSPHDMLLMVLSHSVLALCDRLDALPALVVEVEEDDDDGDE